MATHSSVLAWRIPRTGEPGGLPSLGSHRVGHNWRDLAASAAAAAWAFLVAQMVKNPPAIQEICIQSLGFEDPWRHGKPLKYSCLENPHGQRSLTGYIQSMRSQRAGHDWANRHSTAQCECICTKSHRSILRK